LKFATLGEIVSGTAISVEKLYIALDERRKRLRISWRSLATQLGVAPSTFTRMVQGRRPDADSFAAMVRWLELPMDYFVEGGNEPDPLDMIGTYLRMDKNITSEAAESLDKAIRILYDQMRIEAD
jgi:transcriptional regulator with XRE-family HTH domain